VNRDRVTVTQLHRYILAIVTETDTFQRADQGWANCWRWIWCHTPC